MVSGGVPEAMSLRHKARIGALPIAEVPLSAMTLVLLTISALIGAGGFTLGNESQCIEEGLAVIIAKPLQDKLL